MNSFSVEFKDNVSFDKMVAGIKSVAYNQAYQQDGTTFTFDKVWGTDQKSLNNLKAMIELKSGRNSVEDIQAG
jgi:hypothetical protein